MLVSLPLDKNETSLPSPEQLKRKILLKHKKLPDGADEILQNESGAKQDFDIASSVKNGILYVRDNEYFEWKPHFFVLTESKMFYSEACRDEQENDEESEDETSLSALPTVRLTKFLTISFLEFTTWKLESEITPRFLRCSFCVRLTAPLNLCPIYLKLLVHVHL